MATPDMDVIKEIPGYKVILKAVLKSQIQQLVEQLANTTDEESVILTASVADGTLCHLGSDSGKVFLEDHEDIKSQFLGFCLKRHHKQRQEKERQEAEEALARSMPPVTPPKYGGMGPRHSFMPQRSPRYTSPHPVALSRASPGGQMRSPGPRHQPYPMTRPQRTALSFDQQVRPPGQASGPGPSRPLVGNRIDGQVIKIEPDDDEEQSNQSTKSTGDDSYVQTSTDTNILQTSQQSSPSGKPSTPSHLQGLSASDNEDAKSESSSSAVPNEAFTGPPGGLTLDMDLSNTISSASTSLTESAPQGSSSAPQTPVGLDPNVSVKLESMPESEMDLEITGVELGQTSATSQDWLSNVQNPVPGSSDAAGTSQQGYNSSYSHLSPSSKFSQDIPAHIMPDVSGLAKKNQCRFCGKCHPTPAALRLHERKHTGEKPYVCPICYKGFAHKSNLKAHSITHMNIPNI